MFKLNQLNNPVVAGTIYTLIIVLIGALITSLILSFTSVKETALPSFIYLINVLALFIGGFVSGKKEGRKGWYYGGLVGLAYYLIVLLLLFLGFNTDLSIKHLYNLLGSFLISAFGGIIGINVSQR
ncbi:MAG TPA: TIGR04086 family membrane protein [Paenibacillaceae bacterium]|nr:TIGR04086 family membrane protein [Paenibacillaceae bacterium]